MSIEELFVGEDIDLSSISLIKEDVNNQEYDFDEIKFLFQEKEDLINIDDFLDI